MCRIVREACLGMPPVCFLFEQRSASEVEGDLAGVASMGGAGALTDCDLSAYVRILPEAYSPCVICTPRIGPSLQPRVFLLSIYPRPDSWNSRLRFRSTSSASSLSVDHIPP